MDHFSIFINQFQYWRQIAKNTVISIGVSTHVYIRNILSHITKGTRMAHVRWGLATVHLVLHHIPPMINQPNTIQQQLLLTVRIGVSHPARAVAPLQSSARTPVLVLLIVRPQIVHGLLEQQKVLGPLHLLQPRQLLQLPLMLKNERVTARSPALQHLLASDIRVWRVNDPANSPMRARTAEVSCLLHGQSIQGGYLQTYELGISWLLGIWGFLFVGYLGLGSWRISWKFRKS